MEQKEHENAYRALAIAKINTILKENEADRYLGGEGDPETALKHIRTTLEWLELRLEKVRYEWAG